MNLISITSAQGLGTTETVVPGESVLVEPGCTVECRLPFLEVTSIVRIDDDLHLVVGGGSAVHFKQFFTAGSSRVASVIKFQDREFSIQDFNQLLSVTFSLTDAKNNKHAIALLCGSALNAHPGEIFHLNTKEFKVENIIRRGNDLLIQSNEAIAKTSAILIGFFSKPVSGSEPPQLQLIDPEKGSTQDVIIHPNSSVFQWHGEPLPLAVVGSLYGYYFQLQGQDAENYVLVAQTSTGALPAWLSFAHLGGGRYFLSGMPTPDAVGTHEISIFAHSTKSGVGLHTQQYYRLQIHTSEDIITRAAVTDVVTGEFRRAGSLSEAESQTGSVASAESMPYLTMPELAAISTLAVSRLLSFDSLHAGRSHSFSDHGQNGLGWNGYSDKAYFKGIILNASDKPVSSMLMNSLHDSESNNSNGRIAHDANSAWGEGIFIMGGSSKAFSPLSRTGGDEASRKNTLAPPPEITLETYLDGPHGFGLNGDLFLNNTIPGMLGGAVTILPEAMGNGFGALAVLSGGARVGDSTVGGVYYIPGQALFTSRINLADVNGSVLYSTSDNLSQEQIYGIGDYSGDGVKDLLLAPTDLTGPAYIVFGPQSGFPALTDLNQLVSTGGAMAITYSPTNSPSFSSGGFVGDVDGSGYSDVVLVHTSSSLSPTTAAYVFFGGPQNASSIDVSALNGVNGFQIVSPTVAGAEPSTVTGVDINGSGINDILFKTSPNAYSDTVSVIFGNSTGYPSIVNTSLLGSQGQPEGFQIYNGAASSLSPHHFIGAPVNIGNFNGKGADDIVLNDVNSLTGNTTTYVIFGSDTFTNGAQFDVQSLNGRNGFSLTSSVGNHTVTSIASLGDVNGDGISDFGFIDPLAYGGVGSAYIIFGSTKSFFSAIDYNNLKSNQGLVIKFTPRTYASTIGGGGDLNGDGLADIVFGNPDTNVGSVQTTLGGTGAAYIVFGDNFSGIINQTGEEGVDLIQGKGAKNIIFAGSDDHTINLGRGVTYVNTGAGHDIINGLSVGGSGRNTIVYSALNTHVYAGSGNANTLWLQYDGTNVNFVGDDVHSGFNVINLRPVQNMVGNSVTFDAAAVRDMTNLNSQSHENLMTINGDGHGTVHLVATDYWMSSAVTNGYTTFTSLNGVLVNVQNAVHVVYQPPAAPVTLDFTLSSLMDDIRGMTMSGVVNSSITPSGNINSYLAPFGFELSNVPSTDVTSIAILGDVNGDGIGDIAFVDSLANNGQGAVIVLFGNNNPSLTPIDYSTTPLTSSQGLVITDPSGLLATATIGATGDLNGEGLSDLVITSGVQQYVVLGANFNGAITQLGDVNHPIIQGVGSNDVIYSGSGNYTIIGGPGNTFINTGTGQNSITGGVGVNTIVYNANDIDVNAGSGLSNTLWFAADNTHVSFVGETVFTGFGILNLKSVLNVSGNSITLNADAVDTLSHTDSVIIHGGTLDNLNLVATDYWVAGAVLRGQTTTTYTSLSGSVINVDNAVNVLFEPPSLPLALNFDLSALTDGIRGYTQLTAPPITQTEVYLGDMSGYGVSAFAVVDQAAFGGLGAVYVVFSNSTTFPTGINYATMTSSQGFTLHNDSGLVITGVSAGGDLNGDGLKDLVISFDNNTSDVVLGANFTGAITQQGVTGIPIIRGLGSHDVIYAGTDNHTIYGGSGTTFINTGTGANIIIGGSGQTTIVYSPFNISVNAGLGLENTLWLQDDNTTVNFITTTTTYQGIADINLLASQSLTGNTVILDADHVLSMTPQNDLTINGGGYDNVILQATDYWTSSAVLNGYTTFTSLSGSIVNVQNSVQVLYAPPAAPVSLSYDVGSLMDGLHGFVISATSAYSATSSTIIQNGDGFGNLLIANGYSGAAAPFSRAFIIDGQATFQGNMPANDPLLTLTSFNNDAASSPLTGVGQHVASLGHFNGDGMSDILIQNFMGGPDYIMLGGFTAPVTISTAGIQLYSASHYSNTGATLGDVNGDGFSDLILSNSNTGWGAVVYGSAIPGSTINLDTLGTVGGAAGLQISMPGSQLPIGVQDVAGVDLSGDGHNEILVSYYDTVTQTGGIGVILGQSTPFSPEVQVSSLAGIVPVGATGTASGFLISNSAEIPGPNNILINPTNIGNFTGNGIDSLAVSSNNTVYVIFGSAAFSTSTGFDVSTLSSSTLNANNQYGFELTGGSNAHITSIAYLGDVNGDAQADFGFFDRGAYNGNGAAYVIFGGALPSTQVIDYTQLTSNEGFVITNSAGFTDNNTVNTGAGAALGAPTVSGGGDLNGDGLSDIVLTSGSNQYVVFGANFNGAITQLGDPNHTIIQGTDENNVIYGGSDQHTINGGSGTTFINSGTGGSIINAGSGETTIVYSAFDTDVNAGSSTAGNNILWFEHDGTLADLQDTIIFKDLDVINLRPLQSMTGNTVTLNAAGIEAMSNNDALKINGGPHDNLVLVNGNGIHTWHDGGTVTLGGHQYTDYYTPLNSQTIHAYAEQSLNQVSII